MIQDRVREVVAAHGLQLGPHQGWCVLNPTWGDKRVLDGKPVYLQVGIVNDYVLQGVGDAKDLYRVGRKFWQNTYSLDPKK